MKRLAQVVLNAEGTMGGEQRHVLHVIDGLDPERYSVDVVTWEIPSFVTELARRGVPTLAVTARRILDPGLFRLLRSRFADGGYDLVHAHGHRAGLLARLAAIRAGVPHVVWTCHLAGNKADGNPVVRLGYRRMLRYLDHRTELTIAVSEELAEWLVSEGIDPDGIRVIPNGVDTSVFHDGPRDRAVLEGLGLDPDAPVVGTVARLTEQKGVETLVRAAASVARIDPRIQFVIVGGGPLAGELRSLARSIGARIVFAGERTDIPEFVRNFDVAVVPSLWEGAFCFTVLEAMASRRPLICSDIRMFTDVVGPGQEARVFAVGDPDSLASTILEVIAAPEAAELMAEAGMRLVRERFSVETLQERMSEVYDGILGGERS